ncbi:MAG: potassium/proton antiporter [Actinomycetota bacterium]|nr:MAG: potassium/proton antiporter [Actinomycetota bacterium]
MTTDQLSVVILLGSAIVLVAVVGVRLAARLGVPGLLLYLFLGIALGEDGLGIVFDDADLATVLGYVALAIILAEGGLTTRVTQLRPVAAPALALASVGMAVSIGVVATVLHVGLGTDWRTALLLGTVLAPTDAAAVFSVLRSSRVAPRLRVLLEAEAGFNDAPAVVLVAVLSSTAFGDASPWLIPVVVLIELVAGAVIGLAVGYVARVLLPRLALPASGLYPIATLAFIATAYGLASFLHTSGFMAVYVASVLIAASPIPHRRSVIGFVEGLAWTAQIGLFIMLGLLSDPSRLTDAVGIAVVTCLALVFLARPLSVVVSLVPFRLPPRWRLYLSWAGLRGAVPIVFASIPLGENVPDSAVIFDATLLVVVVLTLVQTPTLPWFARRIGVEESTPVGELEVDSAPLDGMRAGLLGLDVPAGSNLVGTYVRELGLPDGAVVSLVVRDGAGMVPDLQTRLRAGDRLLVVATDDVRSAAERRLRAVSRRGRLAAWLGDSGDPD